MNWPDVFLAEPARARTTAHCAPALIQSVGLSSGFAKLCAKLTEKKKKKKKFIQTHKKGGIAALYYLVYFSGVSSLLRRKNEIY